MNYKLNSIAIILSLVIAGCCGSVELEERIVRDEKHIVPADTIKIIEYVDAQGIVGDDYSPLIFEPTPQCDTASILERYCNLNVELERKNASLWIRYSALKRKLEMEIKTKPKVIYDRDTIRTTKYIEKKTFWDDIKWLVIIGCLLLFIGFLWRWLKN